MPLILLLLVLTVSPAFAGDDATVRVRVFDLQRPQQTTIRAEGSPIQVMVDGSLVATVRDGSTISIRRSGSKVDVEAAGVFAGGDLVRLIPQSSALMRVTISRTTRAYRGAFDVVAHEGSLAVVNVVALDDYIASVVPSEYPFPEIEGVRAQAVLVRTYALRSRGRFGPYDLVDHVGSQVYRGAESETPLAREAAQSTRGEVLTYQGELIEAVYSSSSGGHTADNESIWTGGALPYLRGLPDPYDSASPNHRWSESVDRGRLLAALSRRYGFTVTGLSVAGRSREGRATGIVLHGARERVEQGNRFRLTVNELLGGHVLKSTFFDMERRGDRYVFTGRGFGHGVGMSQYGAREQARQGATYREILYFYFTDVRLERRSSFGQPEPLVADTPPPERIEPRPVRAVATEATRDRERRTGW